MPTGGYTRMPSFQKGLPKDENHAHGSCYLLDFVTDRAASQHPFLLLGHYVDHYVRIHGEWRIAHTALDVVWPQESH
ncbi:Uncharacterised protein [Vibrio furnissii]|nr:Uncharacterised protein [Vibrio furnissii]